MKSLEPSYCRKENKPCLRWIEKYFKDCICNLDDGISFGLGMISFVCWGVAEIPQIVTNFQNKSGHGVSLTFLFTWIFGDIFNLVGCALEPATLPTQLYTAWLYTITTVILVLQCLYYDYLLQWWKSRHLELNSVREERKPLNPRTHPTAIAASHAPVEVPRRREFHYTSARSLARSDTPPCQSYMGAKSGPPALERETNYSSTEEEDENRVSTNKSVTQPMRIPRSVGYGTFLALSFNLPHRSNALMKLTGRRLLQEHEFQHNVYGQWLGWLMAAIYMGGRIPQIWLNIKRGSVEGLNPLMFIFALVANATYVGSILVRSTEWDRIKANLPWLLDAIVCVALDLFIILQYIYYRYITRNKVHYSEDYHRVGDYAKANKAVPAS